jgi:DNA-binding transcriptional regulator YdaS (Cro superfamily)
MECLHPPPLLNLHALAEFGNLRLTSPVPVDKVPLDSLAKNNYAVNAIDVTPEDACAGAIRLAGDQAAVARHFGISAQAVSKWKTVPHKRCLALARLIGGRISVNRMRPDVFGISPEEAQEARRGTLEALS